MIVELLQQRRSVREFEARPVPQAVIEAMLEAGRLSPSGGNEQPWRFGVMTDRALIGQLAEAAYHQHWIASAPLVIVLCTTPVADERGARDIQQQRFPHHAAAIAALDRALYVALNQEEHQTKIAGAHMALTALEQGVGSTWVSRFEVATVARLLNLPAHILPTELLVCGYPAQPTPTHPKKPLGALAFRERFAPKEQPQRWLLHIAPRVVWEAAQAAGVYRGDTLAAEGFIHCSLPEQVLGVANERYRGQAGLVLLCIDAHLVTAPIRDEDCYETGQRFPHIYGPLNLEAVVAVKEFQPATDGSFRLPPLP